MKKKTKNKRQMEGEFKPTKNDLTTIHDRLSELKLKKQGFVDRKIVVQNGLGIYNEKYKTVTYQSPEFYEIKESRRKLKGEFNYLESEIQKINQEVLYKNRLKIDIEDYLRNNKTPEQEKSVIGATASRLNQLRKKYYDFSVDRTRVASLRVMAAEITGEIDKLIKDLNK